MCACDKPNINGTPNAYSWDGKSRMTRQPMPPDLREDDELLYDEPGRCGGLDCHSHHFCLVKARCGFDVVVRHGGGDERFSIGSVGKLLVPSFAALDSNGRYWLMHTLYSTHNDARTITRLTVQGEWKHAAAEKRIKVRKRRGTNLVKVWIEPARQSETIA